MSDQIAAVANIRDAWDRSKTWDEYFTMLKELYEDDWKQWLYLTHGDVVYGLPEWTEGAR